MNQKIISSFLSPISFAKTRFSDILSESGFVFDKETATIEEWRFSGTEESDDGTVWFLGELDEDAKSLFDIFEENKSECVASAAKTVCEALTFAIEQKLPIGSVGALGIFVSEKKVFFLPSKILFQCAKNDRSTFSQKVGFFIYEGLNDFEQPLFTRAVVSYRALCGSFPFVSKELYERQADIFDHNFLPLSVLRPDCEKSLCQAIDSALSIPIDFGTKKSERWSRLENASILKKRQEKIRSALDFRIEDFSRALFSKKETDALFSKKTSSFEKKLKFRVKTKRFFRRNGSRLCVFALASLLLTWFSQSFLSARGKRATSAGLTSEETAVSLYTFIHRADVPNLREIARGRKMRDLIEITTGFYVSSRERESYSTEDRTALIEQWLFLNRSVHSNWWAMGITNLKINGKDADLYFPVPKKKDKNPPIKEENGVPLKKGSKAMCEAEYFFVYTDGAFIHADKKKENVFLEFNGNRWLVREIEQTSVVPFSVLKKDFDADFVAAFEKNDGSIKKTAAFLFEKYPWIPSEKELFSAALSLKEVKNAQAEQFLSEL